MTLRDAIATPLDRLARFARAWSNFWHQPVRAERLGAMRIFLGASLLTNQLFEYLPNLRYFYGPDGGGPAGLYDAVGLAQWRWTLLFFHTDSMSAIYLLFALWMLLTLAFTVGFCTRASNFAVWLLTMAFVNRNPSLPGYADEVLQTALFWLLLSPCGAALSLDAKNAEQRREKSTAADALIAPWSVRLMQLQISMIYAATGLLKLAKLSDPTWRNGTAVHYSLSFPYSRRSFAELPLPLWLTAPGTIVVLLFELGFPIFMCLRKLRRWTLLSGVLLHFLIWVTLDVGWFGLYTVSYYFMWLPDAWASRLDRALRDARAFFLTLFRESE